MPLAGNVFLFCFLLVEAILEGWRGLSTGLDGEIERKRHGGEGLPPPLPRSQNRDLGHPILLLTSDLGHPPRFCIS